MVVAVSIGSGALQFKRGSSPSKVISAMGSSLSVDAVIEATVSVDVAVGGSVDVADVDRRGGDVTAMT